MTEPPVGRPSELYNGNKPPERMNVSCVKHENTGQRYCKPLPGYLAQVRPSKPATKHTLSHIQL